MTEEVLRVEYLVIIDSKNSFCSDEETFNNLLKTNSEIVIKNGKLEYRNLEVEYKIQTKELETKVSGSEKKRFFHLHFKCLDITKINVFEDLLRVVRGILFKTTDTVQTLWDDISFYYSHRAYPLIHEIENLMRKLITKFMLINVGLDWTKNSIPEEVKNSVKHSKRDEAGDYLYKIDFIQLAYFLFNEYSPLPVKTLMGKIKTTTDIKEISLDELKGYVPKSNWEKYFSDFVECDAEYLNKRWKKLYDLRNQIAHNSILSKGDYEEIIRTVDEVKEKLEKAIKSLDIIHISDEDKEVVAENLVSGVNDGFSEFLYHYKTLETVLFMLARDLGSPYKDLTENSKKIEKYGFIDKEVVDDICAFQYIKERGIEDSIRTIDKDTMDNWTIRIEEIADMVLEISINYFNAKTNMDETDKEI